MLVDLPDDMLRAIAKQLAESDLASAVALKRCNSRFKDLATPLVADAVENVAVMVAAPTDCPASTVALPAPSTATAASLDP